MVAFLTLIGPMPAQAAGDDGFDASDVDDSTANDDIDQSQAALKGQAGTSGGLTVEGLVLRRSDIETVPLTAPNAPAAAYTLVDSTVLEGKDYAPGVRVSLQAEVLGQGIEFSAFYLNPISLEGMRLGFGSSTTDTAYYLPLKNAGSIADMATSNSHNTYGLIAHHETKLYGAEANLAQPLGIPGLIVGARAIYFGEHLTTTSIRRSVDTPPSASGNSQRDHAGVRMDNQLVGVQLGLQHMFDVGDAMRIGGSVKGGLYSNFVDRNRTVNSENRVDRSWEGSDHDRVFAQGVEINPRIEFKLAEGTYLTAAGQFLWLNNVGTAVPHYDTIGVPENHDVRAKDDVFFYGGSLGMTIALDQSSPTSNSLPNFPSAVPSMLNASGDDIDERVAELEESTARKGNSGVSLTISGWINRMVMAWDDGVKKDVYVVDNVASRSRVNFDGAVQIARGWSAGYLLSLGLDDTASNDVSQLTAQGDNQIEVRHSAWWLRNSQLGTVTLGLTSTATDNIILKDVGGIMPGAANMATIGGGFFLRRADYYGQGDSGLIISGAYTTPLNDIIAGASVDTLRRNVIRYDAPRLSGQWGNVDLSAAWGEDDFYDVALEHGINYDDWKFRFGAGFLRDLDEGSGGGHRDRREYKGSASLLHIPTGLFGTVAYVHRTFDGQNDSNQVTFGENVVIEYDASRPNRPPTDYLYSAFGLRRQYWSIGDTSVYGEYGQVNDAIQGMREAGLRAVFDSSVSMFGAAICQDIDDAGMDLYAGVRIYSFDTQGLQYRNSSSSPLAPAPLSDLMFGYAGSRIKF
jgi:hypothetical protein